MQIAGQFALAIHEILRQLISVLSCEILHPIEVLLLFLAQLLFALLLHRLLGSSLGLRALDSERALILRILLVHLKLLFDSELLLELVGRQVLELAQEVLGHAAVHRFLNVAHDRSELGLRPRQLPLLNSALHRGHWRLVVSLLQRLINQGHLRNLSASPLR